MLYSGETTSALFPDSLDLQAVAPVAACDPESYHASVVAACHADRSACERSVSEDAGDGGVHMSCSCVCDGALRHEGIV